MDKSKAVSRSFSIDPISDAFPAPPVESNYSPNRRIEMDWRYVIGRHRQWCRFTSESSPRLLLAAIDRTCTKSNYSVYEDMTGLRVYTAFAKIKIKNRDKEYDVSTEPYVPRLWLVLPLAMVAVALLAASSIWAVLCLPASIFVYNTMNRISSQKAVTEIENFKEQLADILRAECGCAVSIQTSEQR